jgi:DNA-binding IclR family transcriptional regulator
MAAVRTQTAPALNRALSLLEIIACSRGGLTLPDIADQAKLPKSSAHYLLVTLERRGYLQRCPRNGRYLFGNKLFSLAHSSLSLLSVGQQMNPFLSALNLRTGLTVHLAVRDQDWALIIAKRESRRAAPFSTCVGKQMDLHCTAVGKALIANLPAMEVDAIIQAHGLSRHNENTIVNARHLHQHLSEVAMRGYAFDDEEDELGVRCVGLPIFTPDRRVIASISVSGTTSEITLENLQSRVTELKNSALSIERAIAAPASLPLM